MLIAIPGCTSYFSLENIKTLKKAKYFCTKITQRETGRGEHLEQRASHVWTKKTVFEKKFH